MTHPAHKQTGGGSRRLVAILLAIGLVLAVVVIVIGIRRTRDSAPDKNREAAGQTTLAPPVTGGASTDTTPAPADLGTRPTPATAGTHADPTDPDMTSPEGAPPASMAGVYSVSFKLRANTCAQSSQPSTHEIEIVVDANTVTVTDRLTKSTLTGAGGSDGTFVVELKVDRQIGDQREVMRGRVEGSRVTGTYWAYPPFADAQCVVEYTMDGSR